MSTPKRRPWFRIHLSTAIVLMFVAGGLVWMNLRPPEVVNLSNIVFVKINSYGWPRTFLTQKTTKIDENRLEEYRKSARSSGPSRTSDIIPFDLSEKVSYGSLVFDAAIALVLLISCAIIVEYILRRKKIPT
jgi:hypothetical protein